MATRAPFLTQSYGAYYHRDVPDEDEELTHVGPGTPCGEYLRRFWQPVALSKDLQELPRRVRILGEDLVVFRDKSGQVGCLELHCPHRGTSLELGMLRNMVRRGIRAVQNGQDPEHVMWKDGQVIPTYSNHTVIRVPKAPMPEAEEQLLRDTGRRVAEGYLKDHSSLVEYIA